MKWSIQFLQETTEGDTDTTVVTLVVSVVLYLVEISPALFLCFCESPQIGATEVVKIILDLLKLLKS